MVDVDISGLFSMSILSKMNNEPVIIPRPDFR